ncbi:MAG: ABC transporter permease [Gemmatimonadales bacterium]
MDALLQDLRLALRQLVKSPGFSAVAVLTLALGIGAISAMFSIVDGVLLRPLPYREADRIFMLFEKHGTSDLRPASYPTFEDWQRQNVAFDGLVFIRGKPVGLRGGEGVVRLGGAYVSPGFFHTIGAQPLRGRTFTRDEEQPGGGQATVLTYGAWQQHFGGDPGVVGRTISLEEGSYTVMGVLPPGARYPDWADLYFPIATILGKDSALTQRGLHADSRVIGRLKGGLTPAQGASRMAALATQLAASYPRENAGWTSVELIPLRSEVFGFGTTVQHTLVLLAAAVTFVLLIACANVASLSLVRAAARGREFGIRLALGAGRWRVARQLLVESAVLAATGGGLGILLAVWVVGALKAAPPEGLPRVDEIHVNGAMLAFTAAVSLLIALAIGMAPAGRATPDLLAALKEGTPGTGTGAARSRLRAALVAGEVAAALLLLSGGGLLLRSFWRLSHVDPGFNPSHLVTLDVSPPVPKYQGSDRALALYQELAGALAPLPGVERVALSNHLPLGGSLPRPVVVPDRPPEPGANQTALFRTVSANYFLTMEIPVRKGRAFEADDMRPSARVAIVNEAFVRRYWPDGDPIGRPLQLFKSAQGRADFGQQFSVQVVGVVGDVRHLGLDAGPTPEVYIPYPVNPWGHMVVVVRTATDAARAIPMLKRTVLKVEPDITVAGLGAGFGTMEKRLSDYLATRRFSTALLLGFALSALGLAALGIYGVISHTVSQRTREIGIRSALGARPRDVTRLMIRQSLRSVAVGLAIGLTAALALSRLLSSLLYSVGPRDAATFAAVTLVLGVVALLASYLPARRATKVDPMIALRYE